LNAAEFKEARQKLGLTQSELGHILNTSPVTVRKWEMPDTASNARTPNPVAAQVMRWLLAGYRPPQWPAGKR